MEKSATDDMAMRLAGIPQTKQSPVRSKVADAGDRKVKRIGVFLKTLKTPLLIVMGVAVGFGVGHRKDAGDVLAVNGAQVTRKDFLHRCELAAGPAVARQMVQEELQLQLAQKMGLLPTPEEVDAKWALAGRQPGFEASLAATHKTPEDARRGMLLDLAQNNILTRNVTVTEAEVKQYYDANADPKNPKARYYQPEQVQVAVIVSDREADIQQAIHGLAGGASFADMAARYSKDKSKSDNGLLPAVRRRQIDPGQFPGMEKSLFAMKVGQQLDSVKIGGAYWIIRCVGKAEEKRIPFETAAEECRQAATLIDGARINGSAIQEASANLQKSAKIEVFDKQYKEAAILH